MRRKAVLESFGYEYDMDKLPKLDKQWAKDIKKAVDKFADEVHVEEKNRLRFFDIVEFNKRDQYVVARFFGGLNGGGRDDKWLDYIAAVKELLSKISKEYSHYWLV
jgi:hypothetical protein